MWTNSIKNDNLNQSVNIETNKIYFSLNTEPGSKANSINKNNLSHTINNKKIKWIITIKNIYNYNKISQSNNYYANNKIII